MKRLLLLFLLFVTLLFQGCLTRESITVTEVKQFKTDIKREYKEIKSIEVFHVPTEIQYNYKLTKDLDEDKYSVILKKNN